MYKFENGQISLEDFGQPIGMKLKNDNRWVKRAQYIPWNEIEKRYAELFPSNKGNVAKPLRLALGSCIIQQEYGYSDEEIVLQIQENPYLQYFCGYKSYDDTALPFDPSLMVYFRKRLTPEILGEINEMIISQGQSQNKDDNSDKHDDDNQNKGTMIVDATCAPSQIAYPRDTSLLNKARKMTEKIIDELHTPGKLKPRTYRKCAPRKRKPNAKTIRKAIGKQLGYLKRNISTIEKMETEGCVLGDKFKEDFETIKKVYEQQKYMYDNRCHSVENRIVSLSQPWIRPIVRGKAKTDVEFGAKLDISVCDGWTRLEYYSFNAYNESTKLQEMVESYHQRTGHYPQRILADKIYRNRENINFCKSHGIKLSGPALGRPKKNENRDKKQDYIDQKERIEVERKFSLAKRKCGMGMIVTRLKDTSCHCLAMSVLLLNIRKIEKLLYEFFIKFLRRFKIVFIQ